MICDTMVNAQTSFSPVILLAQPAELKTVIINEKITYKENN